MYRTTTCTMAAIAVLAATAAPALGQACLGIPAGNGQFALGPTASFMEGAKSYGANFQANLDSPISVGAGYALTDVDEVDVNSHSMAASVAYEMALSSVSVCPTAGVAYSWLSEGDLSTTTFPLGIGLGKSFSAGQSLSITPYATSQYLHVRSNVEIAGETATANEFGGTFGLQLGTDRIYGGGGMSMTTFEGSEPVYFVGLGFIIR